MPVTAASAHGNGGKRALANGGTNALEGRQTESDVETGAPAGEQRSSTLLGRVALWISIQAIFVVVALLITAALQSGSA